MKNDMKIGEVAQLIGCSVETIRFYEKEGLLQTALRQHENNYRYYQQHHLERLRFIRRCRSLGMTHEEIRILLAARLEQNDCHEINDLIEVHLEHVQHRIQELHTLELELQQLRLQCQGFNPVENCGILRELERERDTTEISTNVHTQQLCNK